MEENNPFTTEEDAYKQYDDLVEKYTKRWHVRPDIYVTAYAWDRLVSIEVGLRRGISLLPPSKTPPVYQDPERKGNVGTFRELAAVLTAACDFVDQANPGWASISSAGIQPAEDFEGESGWLKRPIIRRMPTPSPYEGPETEPNW